MSATDELRRMLDERGVEWSTNETLTDCWTRWNAGKFRCTAIEINGTFAFTVGNSTPEQAVEATLGTPVTGETSDGYHTFNELYHHRAVLFSVIVRDHIDSAWKSKAHHDGSMYDGMFIVGIETPSGQATYHCDIDPYWDMFDCKELSRAPEWDGHTPDDAIERIATLGTGTCKVESMHGYTDAFTHTSYCVELSCHTLDAWEDSIPPSYCPICGRRVVHDG